MKVLVAGADVQVGSELIGSGEELGLQMLSNSGLSKLGVEVVVDGRNCLDDDAIRDQDVLYRGIGR